MSKRDGCCRGSLVIELMMVIPFLIILTLISFEVSRFIRCRQAVAVLIAETGKSIYRSCSEFLEDPIPAKGASPAMTSHQVTMMRTGVCINNIMNRTAQQGYASFAGTTTLFPPDQTYAKSLARYLNLGYIRFAVNVFDFSNPPTFPPSSNLKTIFNYQSSPLFVTKFYNAQNGYPSIPVNWPIRPSVPFANPTGAVNFHKRFVTVEASFQFNGIFTRAFGLGNLSGEVYDAAIF